jgi:hypothetical protein
MSTSSARSVLAALGFLLLAGCGGKIATTRGQECSSQLRVANHELQDAKVKGFDGTIEWLKAADLLIAAGTQEQLERFDSCLDKVARARAYIHAAKEP